MVAQISPERESAQATYPAELRTIGAHTALTLAACNGENPNGRL